MDAEAFKALVSQGGFAVLAAVLIYLGWRDMKEARALFGRVLDITTAATAAQGSLTAAIDALRGEVAGLRSGLHDRVIPAISAVQTDVHLLDKRVADLETRREDR